jgi:hypothetical protein
MIFYCIPQYSELFTRIFCWHTPQADDVFKILIQKLNSFLVSLVRKDNLEHNSNYSEVNVLVSEDVALFYLTGFIRMINNLGNQLGGPGDDDDYREQRGQRGPSNETIQGNEKRRRVEKLVASDDNEVKLEESEFIFYNEFLCRVCKRISR